MVYRADISYASTCLCSSSRLVNRVRAIGYLLFTYIKRVSVCRENKSIFYTSLAVILCIEYIVWPPDYRVYIVVIVINM